jgi:hypothetical protein
VVVTEIGLDWRHCVVSKAPRPCRVCGRPALMVDPEGLPCHKVCAEAALVRQLGLAGARAQMALSFRPRAGKRGRS